MNSKVAPQVMELNLLIMYINGWEEDSPQKTGEKLHRVWNSYPYEVLVGLEMEGYLRRYPKSVVLTKKGIAKAQEIKNKYNL